MAVKETPETNATDVELEWNAENELQLFQVLCGNKPIGISRFFQMACVVEKLASNLNKEVTSRAVWDHLSTMYDLKKLDELEGVPFPIEENDFTLSPREFGDLMTSKVEESELKKPTKKEDDKKKEKLVQPEPSPPAEKKPASKRTRASTGNSTPTTPTTAVTPKRRRI